MYPGPMLLINTYISLTGCTYNKNWGMKSFPDEQKPEPLALRSKALSLELLLSALPPLENSGVCFRSSNLLTHVSP